MIGRVLGPYQILSKLGEGGMGEVYRARDERLGRDVAIKVLPAAFTNDSERLARFEREARALAALNHPNIATIHGIEDSGGIRALVMELVEGGTLADRIGSRPLELSLALAIARQLADALGAAHEKGIVHRDLKPSNITLTSAGLVKVLDFGLAKALDEARAADAPDALTRPAETLAGVVIGTSAYMSPEQARGEPVDKRTDIWAFGCVLYQMLTGSRAFGGKTISETLAEVLKADPDWRQLPADTPDAIRRLLDRCLRKDRGRRLHDISDARLDLDEPPAVKSTATGARTRERAAWAIALAASLGALALFWPGRKVSPAQELRLDLVTPPTPDPSFAVSPDGASVVFVAPDAGVRRLWVRPLGSYVAQPLRGTEGAVLPFWSPDGRAIGFFADAQLKRIVLDDGSVHRMNSGPIPAPYGGSWNRDGTILYSPSPGAPIMRTAVDGGEPRAVTRFEHEQRYQGAPHFLPDHRHFLFFVDGPAGTRGVHIGQLDDVTSERLFDADGPAVFAQADGHLFFTRGGKLLAQSFDPDRRQLRGDSRVVDEQITPGTTVSAAANGTVTYSVPPPDSGVRQLTWIDRRGQELQKVVYPDSGTMGPALSSDGRRVALHRVANSNSDIWLYDIDRRTWDRATVDPGDEIYPLWSPDGTQILFGSRRGSMDLYVKRLNTPLGSEQLLLSTPQVKFPTDWSRDGRFVLFNIISPDTGSDVWVLPLDGTRTPEAVVATASNELQAQFSPDGQWLAYQSDRTGRFEIYVRPFPGPGADSIVSTEGGSQVRWNPTGRELFYLGSDDRLMAVPIRRVTRDALELGSAQPLFMTNVGSTVPNTNRHQYMVSPDGESFVMNSRPDQSVNSSLRVLVNWAPRP